MHAVIHAVNTHNSFVGFTHQDMLVRSKYLLDVYRAAYWTS